jgi:hypothetical protein
MGIFPVTRGVFSDEYVLSRDLVPGQHNSSSGVGKGVVSMVTQTIILPERTRATVIMTVTNEVASWLWW